MTNNFDCIASRMARSSKHNFKMKNNQRSLCDTNTALTLYEVEKGIET